MDRVVVRYHEIVLKRGNRPRFVRQLVQNIQRILKGTGVEYAGEAPARLIFELQSQKDWPEVRRRLAQVFGVANFLLAHRTERDVGAIREAILAHLGDRRFASFAIRTKRADKTFPVPSPEVSRQIGQAVRERSGAAVDLDSPELEIHVEITPEDAFLSFEKVAGPGGLPVGSSGRVLALLSGGIDSPVAAHRMMRRGCRVHFVHFHGAPLQSRASQEKAVELAERLTRWQGSARLYLVPFGLVQREIVAAVAREYRVVLYRRMMVRIAEALAARCQAAALVTGESLGQVASQTLSNLAVIENAASRPILRPLIGMDKLEISDQAERIGTYGISILPDEDCCSLFVPRHPATRMTIREAEVAEQAVDIPALVHSALDSAELLRFAFPPERGVEPRALARTPQGTE